MPQPPSTQPHAPGVDWDAIFRRLDEARLVLERGGSMDSAQAAATLRSRAAALAQATQERAVEEEWLEVVEFRLAHETYGLASHVVREVFPLKELTPLPGTPPFVRGIVNVRGHIYSIIDLKRFFDLPDKGITDLNKVILIQHADSRGVTELGVLADLVFGIRRVEIAAMQPALPTLTGIRADYLLGLTADRLIVLDAVKILTDPQLVIRDEAEL